VKTLQVRTTDIFGLVEEELQKHVSGSPGGKKLPVILAIDGRCGSGKTTLAGMIAHRYKAGSHPSDPGRTEPI
jgi:signal recognition particle GTPase